MDIQHTQKEIELRPIGNSWGIILDKYFRDYLGIENGDKIIIRDDLNKKGQRFVSFWKKGK